MKPEFKFFPEHRYYFVSQDKQTMNAIKSVPKDSSKLVPFHLYAFFAGSHDNVKTFFESRTCFDFDYIILDKQDLFFHSEAGFDSFLFLILEKSYLVEFNKKDVYILKKNVKGEVCI